MLGLVIAALVILGLLALPFLILRLALGVVFALITLPFKLLGVIFKVVFGILGGVFRLLFSGMGLIAGLFAWIVFLVLIPFLPFVLLGLGVWIVLREARSSRRALRIA